MTATQISLASTSALALGTGIAPAGGVTSLVAPGDIAPEQPGASTKAAVFAILLEDVVAPTVQRGLPTKQQNGDREAAIASIAPNSADGNESDETDPTALFTSADALTAATNGGVTSLFAYVAQPAPVTVAVTPEPTQGTAAANIILAAPATVPTAAIIAPLPGEAAAPIATPPEVDAAAGATPVATAAPGMVVGRPTRLNPDQTPAVLPGRMVETIAADTADLPTATNSGPVVTPATMAMPQPAGAPVAGPKAAGATPLAQRAVATAIAPPVTVSNTAQTVAAPHPDAAAAPKAPIASSAASRPAPADADTAVAQPATPSTPQANIIPAFMPASQNTSPPPTSTAPVAPIASAVDATVDAPPAIATGEPSLPPAATLVSKPDSVPSSSAQPLVAPAAANAAAVIPAAHAPNTPTPAPHTQPDGADSDTASATTAPSATTAVSTTTSAPPAQTVAAPPITSAQPMVVEASLSDALVERQLDMAAGDAWIDDLATDIARSASREGTMRFRLNPEMLGAVGVTIEQGGDGAAIRFTTGTEDARRIIADAQPRLIAEAGAHGLRISESTVDLAPEARSHANSAQAGMQQTAQPQQGAQANGGQSGGNAPQGGTTQSGMSQSGGQQFGGQTGNHHCASEDQKPFWVNQGPSVSVNESRASADERYA